jgi:hypothetical protein
MKPKNILQRVLDFALGELDRRGRGDDASSEQQLAARDDASELEPEHDGAADHLQSELAPPAARGEPAGRPDQPSQPRPQVQGLEAVRAHGGEGLTLRWSISDADVSRAQVLLTGKHVLCLRVVSFTGARDDVLREVQDRPGVELQGECELADAPQRGVVALGLRAGERFVSIAHHVL